MVATCGHGGIDVDGVAFPWKFPSPLHLLERRCPVGELRLWPLGVGVCLFLQWPPPPWQNVLACSHNCPPCLS